MNKPQPQRSKASPPNERSELGNHDCEYDSDGAPCNHCGRTASEAIIYFERRIRKQRSNLEIDYPQRSDQPLCELCGELMPKGEEMFKFHGYSGPCPKPPLSNHPSGSGRTTDDKQEWWVEQTADGDWSLGSGNRGFALFDEQSVALDVRDRHNAALREYKEKAWKYDQLNK